jgi:hypothetical protein
MALNVGLDISFNNTSMQDWKGILKKAGECNDVKVYITNNDTSH